MFMRKFLTVFILISSGAFGAGFLSAFDDVPLMDGLSTNPPLVFDTETMRFVEQFVAVKKGADVDKAAFQKFYRDSLPALGWRLVKNEGNLFVFRREGEALAIEVKSENPFVARFSLSPWSN